jgi:predicted Zn-dependent peptidase
VKRLILICAALAAAPAFAQEAQAQQAPARETPPPPGPPKDFQLPELRRTTLPNGLKLTMVEYGAVPKALVALSVQLGFDDEAESERWIADLLGRSLLEGTTTRPATRLNQEAARMGGSLDVSVSPERTLISSEVLSEATADALRLVADVAQNPAFDPAAVERKRADLLRELSLQRSRPQSVAHEAFLRTLFPGQPYGKLFPTEAELAGYTPERVRKFYQDHFGAGRSHLYVVGRFDAGAVEAAVREAFAGWKAGQPRAVAAPAPQTARKLVQVDRPGAVQSTLYIGLPVPGAKDPEWIAFGVTNALLGGSFSSRITANIREKKGYTYSPNSSTHTVEHGAYWLLTADVTTKNTGASIEEILSEIDRLGKEAPEAAELKGIQNFQAGIFVIRSSSRGGIAGQLDFVDRHGLGDDFLATYVHKVHATTPEQVRALTAGRIPSGKLTFVVVGDLATVREQVERFGATAP